MANITKREVLTKAIATEGIFTEDEIAVLKNMIDKLDAKSTKPTKAQKENVGIKNEILVLLADGRARTAREVADATGYTVNKVSALLRAIVLDGKAEKVPGEKAKDAPKYVAIEGAEPYPTAEDTPQE